MNITRMRIRFLTTALTLYLLTVGGACGLFAQLSSIQPMSSSSVVGKARLGAKLACPNDAGEIAGFIDISAQSNSFNGATPGGSLPYNSFSTDTFFLCRGDEFTIDFDEGSEDLSGDPDPSTLPGIGWAFYRDRPTLPGTSLAELNGDPANPADGNPPFQSGNLLVDEPLGYFTGNYGIRLENVDAPFIPGFFPGPDGRPSPVVLFTAPITVDSLDISSGNGVARAEFVRDSDGTLLTEQCINVRTDQVVAVGYLNPVEAANQTQSATGCTGSFTVRGGISELRESAEYTITIRNTVTNELADLDRPTGEYLDDDVVNYTVPTPGNYIVSIEDGMSCSYTSDPITFAAGACSTIALNLTVTSTAIACSGDTDGALTVSATGGVPNYSFSFTRTSPTTPPRGGVGEATADDELVTFSNLPGGQYSVTVTDATGTSTTQSVEVFEPNITVGIQTVQDIQCFDDDNGALRATIFDGSNEVSAASYTFLWSNGATTQDLSDLGPGSYSVTATNNTTGCVSSDAKILRAPNRLLIENSARTSDPATCSGVSDGTVDVPVSGGTRDPGGNYTISWSDSVQTIANRITRTDLLPGEYTVVVTDANGCEASTTFVIAAEKTLILNADSTNVSCFGDGDGSITVTAASVGAPADLPFQASLLFADGTLARPFTTIPDAGATPVSFDNLAPGAYIIVLKDQDTEGCEVRQSITIAEPDLLEIADEINTTDVGCPDIAGSATVDVTGGTQPYTYRFVNDSLPSPVDTSLTFDSTTLVGINTIGDLQPDTNYLVIVTDANGCVDTASFVILSPPQAQVSIPSDAVLCPGDENGQLTATIIPPDTVDVVSNRWFRINPDGSRGALVSTEASTGNNLAVGFYEFELTLSNDCVSSYLGEVRSPGLVVLDSFNLVVPECRGESSGGIFLFPSGGTPGGDGNYNYVWSGPSIDTADTRSSFQVGLLAGSYRVIITDANGCQPPFDTTFTLEDPVGITGTFTIDDVSCPDDTTADGVAIFAAQLSDSTATGTNTFDFFWSTGDTIRNLASSTVRNLTRGPISVTVTDGRCPQIFTDTVGSPEDFAFSPNIIDASCSGQATGSVTVDVTGGTPGYSFSWVDRPEVTNTLRDLPAGTYELVVADSRACVSDTASFTVDEPDALRLATTGATTPLVTCFGDEDGVISVFVSSTNNNPLPDNPYTWSPNVEDRDDGTATDLRPGDYSVTVTDVNGCIDSLEYTILEPSRIGFTVQDILPPACFGEQTTFSLDTAFGGQASEFIDYSFVLNEDGFLFPAGQPGPTFAGDVIVTVFDSVGCSVQDTFNVQQPPEIVIDLPEKIVIELGDSMTRLNPLISPATDQYIYKWTPPDYLSSDSVRAPTIFPLTSEEYTLTATNQNGCEALADIFVEVDANRNVYIPNSFSPNEDGRNDDFRVYACRGVTVVKSVSIYNRWGGLVSRGENLPASCLDGTLLWDGTVGGLMVGTGVYVYVIEVTFLDNFSLTYRGDISVLR